MWNALWVINKQYSISIFNLTNSVNEIKNTGLAEGLNSFVPARYNAKQ
jgi:hypothetical protein